jgi:segregation and condensation protein B
MEDHQAVNVMEAALLCADTPMTVAALQKVYWPEEVSTEQIEVWLNQLQSNWQDRGLELAQISTGWRFQSKANMQRFLEKLNPERTPKYSRAVLETLAIIAWKQPVTRADIEAIRGVTVSSQIVKTLEERGWVETLGHRDAPGRPALLGTTKQFLDDLGLRALDELPPLQPLAPEAPDLGGLVDANIVATDNAAIDLVLADNELEPAILAASDLDQEESIEDAQTIQDILETTSADPTHSSQHNQSMDTNPSINPSIDISEQK